MSLPMIWMHAQSNHNHLRAANFTINDRCENIVKNQQRLSNDLFGFVGYFNRFCRKLELKVFLVPILWDQICICAIQTTFHISGWQVFSARLLRGSQFSNTAPLGTKPITYLPRSLFFSAFDISHQRRGKAEKLLKRQCLEFGIFVQSCLG